ncbi:transposase [Bacillus sp. TH22]|uniref:transposase n=1 Tax=unclassified Bacillus (in: firmicutes) TaxID=185979 RepID=UPI001912BAAF|nr:MULTISPECIES: transposase [unclassified Bacillus (in: firmicutes)]MBK5360405.1 transposase [Bacillus sp. TH44]MBK5345659.1 transposase [Bacillus sp. TH45]MBK5367300.1 transposase [Bacillus sp. TH50]MBK5452336.1 transposase [Bacillus sp. TH22]MBK5457747.1 transposase [Bacillus sp. TH23]
MKNHIKVNEKFLQTNKKWSHLKQKQKEHISNWLRREYTQFVKTYQRKPRKYEHDEILHEVMNQIQEREIRIPYGEVKRYYLSKIGKWFRKIESEWESQISNSEKLQVLEEK